MTPSRPSFKDLGKDFATRSSHTARYKILIKIFMPRPRRESHKIRTEEPASEDLTRSYRTNPSIPPFSRSSRKYLWEDFTGISTGSSHKGICKPMQGPFRCLISPGSQNLLKDLYKDPSQDPQIRTFKSAL